VATGAIPSGYVWYSGGSVAVGIGYAWDTALFNNSKDKAVPFQAVGRIGFADVGAAGISAEGEVY